MNRSSRANHFGTLVERKMVQERRFELARESWKDAEFKNGTPVEIKSAMQEHSNAQPGTFKLYRQYHERLHENDGWYCFVVYKPRGRGLRIVADKLVRWSELPLLRWHGGGDHRDTQQAKISIDDVF